MKIDINFNIEDRAYLINEVALKNNIDMVIYLTPKFPINTLTITFTTQMLKDLEKFQSSNKLSRIGMSSGAIGKAFTLDKGEYFVFLDFEIFKGLAESNNSEASDSLHYLHHEIAHLYDDSITIYILPDTFYTMTNLTLKERFLYEISLIAWSEYKANFISISTLTENNFKNYLNGLLNCLEGMRVRLSKSIDEILKDNADCFEIQFLVKDLFYYLGQMIGLMQGAETEFNENMKELLFNIGEQYQILNTIEMSICAFQKINSTYTKWESYKVLKPLNLVMEEFLISQNIEIGDNLIFSILD